MEVTPRFERQAMVNKQMMSTNNDESDCLSRYCLAVYAGCRPVSGLKVDCTVPEQRPTEVLAPLIWLRGFAAWHPIFCAQLVCRWISRRLLEAPDAFSEGFESTLELSRTVEKPLAILDDWLACPSTEKLEVAVETFREINHDLGVLDCVGVTVGSLLRALDRVLKQGVSCHRTDLTKKFLALLEPPKIYSSVQKALNLNEIEISAEHLEEMVQSATDDKLENFPIELVSSKNQFFEEIANITTPVKNRQLKRDLEKLRGNKIDIRIRDRGVRTIIPKFVSYDYLWFQNPSSRIHTPRVDLSWIEEYTVLPGFQTDS